MTPSRRKYALDTNVYVRAFRAADANAEYRSFLAAHAPSVHLSAVVVQELRAGARGDEAHTLERLTFEPLERLHRVFAPSYDAWKRAGAVLAELVAREGLELRAVSRSFLNDVLLALSCREAGVVLVTDNAQDFARIARVTPFEFLPPWPAPTG